MPDGSQTFYRPRTLNRLCFAIAQCFCLLLVLATDPSAIAKAQENEDITFFRIGAGPAGGTVFPSAGWIGTAISNPPGTRPCRKHGLCGVPGLIAVVQTTEGGIANIDGLRTQQLDAAIAYADMAHTALIGTSVFDSQGPYNELRAITALAPESLHILVHKDSKIRSISDLKGKRIAVGPRYSTSQNLAFLVLRLHGVHYGSFRWFLLNPEKAVNALSEKKIDAVMFLSRIDSGVVRQMMTDNVGKLLSLDPAAIEKAITINPYLKASSIPANAYGAKASTATLEMLPVLLISRDKNADFVKELSHALWKSMQEDPKNHPLAIAAYKDKKLLRLGVPLHRGAAEFREKIIKFTREKDFPDPNYDMSKDLKP